MEVAPLAPVVVVSCVEVTGVVCLEVDGGEEVVGDELPRPTKSTLVSLVDSDSYYEPELVPTLCEWCAVLETAVKGERAVMLVTSCGCAARST